LSTTRHHCKLELWTLAQAAKMGSATNRVLSEYNEDLIF